MNAIQTFVAAAFARRLNPQERMALCIHDCSCCQILVLSAEIASYRFVAFCSTFISVHRMREHVCWASHSLQLGLGTRLYIGPSEINGWGLFVNERVEKGVFLKEYVQH